MYHHLLYAMYPLSHRYYTHKQWLYLGSMLGSCTKVGTTPGDRDLLCTKWPGEIRKSTLACVPGTVAKSALDGILLMQCSQLLWTSINYTGKINKMKDPSSYRRQQNPLRLFLMVPDGPERKHDDSHRADLLLETSELTVGPTDLMQHAAVSNNFPVALCESLLENSD